MSVPRLLLEWRLLQEATSTNLEVMQQLVYWKIISHLHFFSEIRVMIRLTLGEVDTSVARIFG
jgi:hypothetical protein